MESPMATLEKSYKLIAPHLDERARRLWCAAQARALGRGGVTSVWEATGVSRPRITRGKSDLDASPFPDGRIRRSGGGRKRVTTNDPALLCDRDALIEPMKRGDPMSGIRWTCKSARKLAKELCAKGHRVGSTTVAGELHLQKYSLQGNQKTKEGSSNHDRNAQFLHIHETATMFQKRGDPVISIDTKKKELIENYKNGGKEWAPQGTPRQVKVHDFIDKKLGKAIPYGVCDIAKNKGFVSVGIDKDTAEFAVATIRRWWNSVGREAYPKSAELYITADGGGSNASRSRLFKLELQKFSDETGLTISVSHYPPGTSKWNKIEHRMFCHITANWRGEPLVSRELIVELISHTTTEKGLTIQAELDTNAYVKGRVVTKQEFATLSLTRQAFHGEWNYTLTPRSRSV
ncbi:ISAzo13 family transposase [Candidatus Peregrinibacteria bacterium]|nr:ISAzo13 family transposase [Candidatus Peregrinibacteria bacterium]